MDTPTCNIWVKIPKETPVGNTGYYETGLKAAYQKELQEVHETGCSLVDEETDSSFQNNQCYSSSPSLCFCQAQLGWQAELLLR